MHRVDTPGGECSGFFISQVRRFQARVGFRKAGVLSISAEAKVGCRKNGISYFEACHIPAYAGNLPCQFLSQDGDPGGAGEADIQPNRNAELEGESQFPGLAVTGGDGRRVHPDEDFVIFRFGPAQIRQLQYLRRAVSCPQYCFHLDPGLPIHLSH